MQDVLPVRSGWTALRPADRRGLTAAGAALLVLVLGGAGAAVDLSTGSTLSVGFAAGFGLGCVLSALAAHPEALRAVAVMPPLLYVMLTLAAGTVDAGSGTGSLPVRMALGLVNAVILGAPVLVGATLVVLLLVLLRRSGAR